MLKTLFFGTPAVAVPFLERLTEKSRVAGVVTSPDKPAGRGYELAPTPVKKAALAKGLPVYQPAKLRDPAVREEIGQWGPVDVGIVVAYGKLIPPEIFNLPKHGLVNVHFSLLPAYRGAGPVQWALIRGEKVTGVTLFRIEAGLDSGPVFVQKAEPVRAEDNATVLRDRLVAAGLELLDGFLARLEAGPWEPAPQKGEVTLAPPLKKEDGRIRWAEQSAEEAVNLVRGAYEWPGATASLKGQSLKVRAAAAAASEAGSPGEIVGVERGKGFLVKCRSGAALLLRVQPEGKKEMSAADFLNGARLKPGDRFDP